MNDEITPRGLQWIRGPRSGARQISENSQETGWARWSPDNRFAARRPLRHRRGTGDGQTSLERQLAQRTGTKTLLTIHWTVT